MNHLNWSRSAGIALTATFVIVCCPAAHAVDWLNNATSNNWNDPTNWANGVVPDGTDPNQAAGVFSATGNIATISTDVTAMPTEVIIGGFGNTGRVDHVAGTFSTQHIDNTWPPGWVLVGLGDTGNATYNLANTATTGGALTGYGTGSGTFNVADALFMGEPNGSNPGTGVSKINVNTTGALNVQWGMFIGVSGWTANVNVDAGTVHANDISLAKIQNGNATAATGNLNISGGSVIANYRMILAEGGANNSATVNQTGGAVSLGSAGDAGWAGLSMANASGDGTTASGDRNGGTATYNLNGGTLATRYVRSENWQNGDSTIINTKGTSTFNFNGGTLKALDNRIDGWNQFIGGDQAITHAYVKAGGAVIDTNGFNVLVGQALKGDTVSTGGGLTKNGEGTLTLAGANTYTGNTVVADGSLVISNNSASTFADTSTVSIASDAVLNLPNAATDIVAALVINGTPLEAGTYDALTPETDGYITGSGTLEVVPSGYTTWASANVNNQPANQDYNNDGVENGVAYFMNNTGVISLPGIVGGTVTWSNGGNIPASAYNSQFLVQTSQNLVNWVPVLSGSLTSNTNGPGGSLTYTLPSGQDKWFVRLIVTPN